MLHASACLSSETYVNEGKHMYAVIVTGGKQYRVEKGDVIYVEKLDAEAESTYTFDTVLAVGEEGSVKFGEQGMVQPGCDNTEIFIYPGYRFKVLDALITNFHLPESTLVMLVSALAGREHILHAYEEAIREKYRFFSFGDAMFIADLKGEK